MESGRGGVGVDAGSDVGVVACTVATTEGASTCCPGAGLLNAITSTCVVRGVVLSEASGPGPWRRGGSGGAAGVESSAGFVTDDDGRVDDGGILAGLHDWSDGIGVRAVDFGAATAMSRVCRIGDGDPTGRGGESTGRSPVKTGAGGCPTMDEAATASRFGAIGVGEVMEVSGKGTVCVGRGDTAGVVGGGNMTGSSGVVPLCMESACDGGGAGRF